MKWFQLIGRWYVGYLAHYQQFSRLGFKPGPKEQSEHDCTLNLGISSILSSHTTDPVHLGAFQTTFEKQTTWISVWTEAVSAVIETPFLSNGDKGEGCSPNFFSFVDQQMYFSSKCWLSHFAHFGRDLSHAQNQMYFVDFCFATFALQENCL